MTSNTNISSDKSEAQLYEVLLYKKKDIIAIQKKLGMLERDLLRIYIKQH
jgi:hypothetical protein